MPAKKVNFAKKPKTKGKGKKKPARTAFDFGANVQRKRRGFGGGSV
jgi:hypothetical protein